MVRRAWLSCSLWAALVGLSGCSNDYQAPTPDQPHAVLELERDYDSSAGLILEERLFVLDQPAFEAASDVSSLGLPRIDMVLLRPEPTRLELWAEFVHYEYRVFWETYYIDGRPSSRYVTRRIRIVDAACRGTEWLAPEVDGRYVLSFQRNEAGLCSIGCRVDQRNGEDPVACPLPSASEKIELESR